MISKELFRLRSGFEGLAKSLSSAKTQKRLKLELKLLLLTYLNDLIRNFLETTKPILWRFFRIRVEVGKFYFYVNGTLFPTHNAGFFSCLSTIASSISELNEEPLKINNRFAMTLYKNRMFANNWQDVFRMASNTNEKNLPKNINNFGSQAVENWWSDRYQERNLNLSPASAKFFLPSQIVEETVTSKVSEFDIKLDQSLAIHYRGTDKVKETKIRDIEEFSTQIKRVLDKTQVSQILILTDEEAAFKAFKKEFGKMAIAINEVRSTEANVGTHFLRSANREKEAIEFFASVLIVSRCKFLITHTGNGALWEYLYRKETNFWQL